MNENTEAIEDETLPEFWGLVLEAQQASEAVDHFDLRSEDPASAREFDELERQQDEAAIKLINFAATHKDLLLEKLKGEA